MGYRVEVWDRPGAAGFTHRDTIDFLRATATRRGSGLGEGGVDVPADLDAARLNRVVFGDKDTPANAVAALIRVYRDGQTSGVDPPFFEWLADARIPPATVEQPDVKASGLDINSLFGWASVEAWDWDGSADWQSLFPDWIWGGRNLLGTLEARYLPEVVTLTVTATAGTVTVTVTNDAGSDTTAAVAFNASAATWKTEIQALTNVDLVDVAGPAGGPFRITFTDPNANTIVGGSAGTSITVVQQGRLVPAGYEESRSYVSDLPHGFNVEFRMWETGDPALPAGCATAVMFNGTEPEYPGFQKVVRVRPGGVYQVRSKVTALNVGNTVRMVVRDMAENEINGAGNARDEQAIAVSGVFQDFDIVNLVIPRDVSEVIVRWGHVDMPGVDPGRIFVACPEFTEGLAATTIGAIGVALYNDAQVDHVADGRQVWGTGPFLELDFDAVLDSGGNAWAEAEVSVRFNLNTNYSLVLAEIARRGYEWRIIPKQAVTSNPADDGVWLLQIFNPGTAGVDYSALADPAILPGTDVVARAGRMFAPSATSVRVQGADGFTSRSTSAAAVGALGRREAGIQAADLFSLADTAAVAASELADRLSRAESISPTVRPAPGVDPTPGVDFDVFDTLNVADVPYVSKSDRRCAAWTATVTPDMPDGEFLLSFTAETFVGQSAVNAGVRRLLREFDAIRRQQPDQPDELATVIGAGGGRPIIVAASDAPANWKAAAAASGGAICTGSAANPVDGDTIQAIIDNDDGSSISHVYIQFSPGNFWISTDTVSGYGISADKSWGVTLQGSGQNVTLLNGRTDVDSGLDRHVVQLGWYSTVRDLQVNDWDFPTNVIVYGLFIGDYNTIENVQGGFGNGWLCYSEGDFASRILNCRVEMDGGIYRLNGSSVYLSIESCFANVNGVANTGLFHIDGIMNFGTIANCSVDQNRDHVLMMATDGELFGCDFVGGDWQCISGSGNAIVRIQTGTTGTVRNCNFVGISISANEGFWADGSGVVRSVTWTGITHDGIFTADATIRITCDVFDLVIDGGISRNVAQPIIIDGTADPVSRITISDYRIFDASTRAIFIDTASEVLIDNVGVNVDAPGIVLDTVTDLIVHGCTVVLTGTAAGHGISLTDCDLFSVDENRVRRTATPNLDSDGIFIDGTYTRGRVTDNQVIPHSTFTRNRYGINPASASATGLIVVDNDARGTWATAPINVANAPILLDPGHATFGDNWT